MIICDTECPYCDQVSLNNTNQTKSTKTVCLSLSLCNKVQGNGVCARIWLTRCKGLKVDVLNLYEEWLPIGAVLGGLLRGGGSHNSSVHVYP